MICNIKNWPIQGFSNKGSMVLSATCRILKSGYISACYGNQSLNCFCIVWWRGVSRNFEGGKHFPYQCHFHQVI